MCIWFLNEINYGVSGDIIMVWFVLGIGCFGVVNLVMVYYIIGGCYLWFNGNLVLFVVWKNGLDGGGWYYDR